MVRRTAVGVALAVALLTACAACTHASADKAATGPTATVATEPAPTTTTDPYAVPSVIDAAYVNRVLAGLDAVIGDVTRTIVRTKTIPPDAYDRLKAVYGTNDLLQLNIDSIQTELRSGLSGLRPDPGNRVSTVVQVISAGSKCVFAQVNRNYLAVATAPNTVNPQWVALRPQDLTRDPTGYNPTRWTLVYDGFTKDRSTPGNPCAA